MQPCSSAALVKTETNSTNAYGSISDKVRSGSIDDPTYQWVPETHKCR